MTYSTRPFLFCVAVVSLAACATPGGSHPSAAQPTASVPQQDPLPPEGSVEEKSLGLRLYLPPGWHRKDASQSGVKVFMFSPQKDKHQTRVTLMRFPVLFLPKGLTTREGQLQAVLGKRYQRLRRQPVPLAGQRGEVLEYEVKAAAQAGASHRTAEYALKRGDWVLIVQFTAPRSGWPKMKQLSDKSLASLRLGEILDGDPLKADQPSKKRGAVSKTSNKRPPFKSSVQILSHDVAVRIEPGSGAFSARDRFTITTSRPSVIAARFLISTFAEVTVSDRSGPLKHELGPLMADDGEKRQVLTVKLRRPLKKGARLRLVARVATDKYIFRLDKTPVSGYHILGQVSAASSYSSHVFYYPVDEANRAGATIRFDVPRGYVAVGPGKLVGQKRRGGRQVFTWRARDGLRKQLPYGWAVGKYIRVQGRSAAKVPIRVYALPKQVGRAKRVLAVAMDALGFYERRFGKFPFSGVSICGVQPLEGIAGVSLPSQVLLSGHFFDGGKSYAGLKQIDKGAKGPMVIADELSHQYNFYGVALPNALAEGMAQYTDSLFAEEVAKADLDDHFAYYSRLYRGAVASEPDQPILSDAAVKSGAYMPIVFCKGAAVLHMLRTLIGKDAFFATLRKLFTDFRGKKAGVEELERIAEGLSGKKLGWFFEQWYRRSGYPKLALTWKQTGDTVEISVAQKQRGEPFTLPLAFAIKGPQGMTVHRAQLEGKTGRFSFPAARVQSVALDQAALLAAVTVASQKP